MSKADITRREFTLQADALSRSPTFTSSELGERLRTALGTHRSGRILDLACGPGLVCEALAPEATEVVGVDLTPEMVARARTHCAEAGHANGTFHEAAVESLPCESGYFDAVVTRLAIHHFEDPAAVLREAWRVLRDGGRLVVLDIVASPHPQEAELHNSLEILRDPSHVRMLPEAELIDVIGAAGFAVAEVRAWDQQRAFDEWAAIVADARSIDALEPVLRALAGAGLQAGIDLRIEEDAVRFVHHWRSVAADKSAEKTTEVKEEAR